MFRPSRQHTGPPRVCKFYNLGDGRCRAGQTCDALHVCRFFLQGTCSFGDRCRRNHNLLAVQSNSLLTKFGLDVKLNREELLTIIRQGYGLPVEGSSFGGVPLSDYQPPTRDLDSLSIQPGTPAGKPSALTDDICTYHLRGCCRFGAACRNHHSDMPYLWQYKDVKWMNFNPIDNGAVEMAFADPGKDNFVKEKGFIPRTFKRSRSFDVVFASMTGEVNDKPTTFRRLGVLSSVIAPPEYIHTTNWVWYWQDDHRKWNKYDTDIETESSDICADLEKAFLKNQDSIDFSTDRFDYTLDFDEMVQKNHRYGTERAVRRRPKYVGRDTVEKLKTNNSWPGSTFGIEGISPVIDKIALPEYWDLTVMSDQVDFKMIQIQKNGDSSDEYRKVEKLFHVSVSETRSNSIKKLFRIQNIELWERYARNRAWKHKKSSKEQEERLLFHGTDKAFIAAICQHGFDWRVSGSSNAALYGKGSYFARDASFSRNYTDCQKLFLVRVLVGEYGEGSYSLVKPPPKDAENPTGPLYDTCVNCVDDPSIFVTFEQERSYPEYLIEYE